jgi:hypothetical protein
MKRRRHLAPSVSELSAFAGFRFPPEVILLAVRWYLRYGLSYQDVEELLAERGVKVDHVTVYRWVQRFTPLLIEAARRGIITTTKPSGRPGEGQPARSRGFGQAPRVGSGVECARSCRCPDARTAEVAGSVVSRVVGASLSGTGHGPGQPHYLRRGHPVCRAVTRRGPHRLNDEGPSESLASDSLSRRIQLGSGQVRRAEAVPRVQRRPF